MNENFTSDVGLQTVIANAELKKFRNSSEHEENLYSFDLVDAINVMAYLIMSLGIYVKKVELFSWKTTSHKYHLEVCLPNSRLLSGLIGMWSSMKITLHIFFVF